MEYSIEIEEYSGIKMVHISVNGLMSMNARNRVAVETIKRMREIKISKVIWDIREAKLDYSLIGSHQVVMDLGALGVQQSDHIAVIYRHNAKQHEHARMVAINRGIINLAYFKEIEEGIAWLVGREKTGRPN